MRTDTYMLSWLKTRAMDCIFVEALPLLKDFSGMLVVFLLVPNQHLRIIIKANRVTKFLNHVCWLVQQIVRINHAYLNMITSSMNSIIYFRTACNVRAHLTNRAKKIEETTCLIITGF